VASIILQQRKAIESYDKAIQIKENNYQVWYNRGNAVLQLEAIRRSLLIIEQFDTSQTTTKLGTAEVMHYLI